MAPRASWKGILKLAELTCPVALFTAVSASERIALHLLDRRTGHRVHRVMVDAETGAPVAAGAQVRGYEVAEGEYVVLEPGEIAAAVPESDKVLAIDAFIACSEVDDLYFDRPYSLVPSEPAGREAFAVLREGMRRSGVAALARTVLFRRLRTVLIRAQGAGLIATILRSADEVRAEREVFSDIPETKIGKEARALARHIIETRRGIFDPRTVEDRYAAALAALVRAKRAGKTPAIGKPPAGAGKVVDLMEALRKSAAAAKPARAVRRKAG